MKKGIVWQVVGIVLLLLEAIAILGFNPWVSLACLDTGKYRRFDCGQPRVYPGISSARNHWGDLLAHRLSEEKTQ